MKDWQAEVDRIYEKHCNRIEKCTPDTILYHYTPPTGLLGIIESSSFWFSDSDFLNDASESFYFYDVFSNIASCESYTRKEREFKFKTYLFSLFHTSSNIEHRKTSDRLKETRFILSLSLDKDNLNLWNYYTKNANGIGYNIGIRETAFENIACPDETILSGKVIYDNDTQIAYLSELIDDYWTLYSGLKHTYQRKYLYNKLEDNMVRYSIFMKNPFFSGESEYRVAVVRHGSDTGRERKFRENNGVFIPYITQKINLRGICEIGISPTHRSQFVKKSVGELLDAYGIDANIFQSEVPLRY